MRLFIAVPLSQEVRAQACALIDELAAFGADYRWLKPDALHVTLSFLGETDPKKVPELERAMKLAARRRAFEMSLGALGAFDSFEEPTVLWVGLQKGAAELAALAAALPQREKRPFAAHLTLGRMRSRKGLGKMISTARTHPPLAAVQLVDKLVLYESVTAKSGPVVHRPVLQVLIGG